MACPFLVVKERGSWDYDYFCKAQGYKKIGSTDDKYLVEHQCRSGHEDCDCYKHPRT